MANRGVGDQERGSLEKCYRNFIGFFFHFDGFMCVCAFYIVFWSGSSCRISRAHFPFYWYKCSLFRLYFAIDSYVFSSFLFCYECSSDTSAYVCVNSVNCWGNIIAIKKHCRTISFFPLCFCTRPFFALSLTLSLLTRSSVAVGTQST